MKKLNDGKKKMELVPCELCGKNFLKRHSELKRTKNNLCSTDCRMEWIKEHPPRKLKIDFKITKGGCFECTSHKIGKRGYPRMSGKLVYRHVYEQMWGPIRKGLVVRHKCDNKLCINPEHLELGTQGDNTRDAFERNRMPIGSERPNAKLNENDVKVIKILLKKSNKTKKEIANRFNISSSVIRNIEKNRTWKHVNI